LRCLIVDDNAAFLAAARSLLERQGLIVVGVASNATEGLECAGALMPDVILVDIDLGRESGFSVARRLAPAAGHCSPTVILISTHPQDDFAELVEQSPAAGFIAKSELSAAAIEEVLGGCRGLPNETQER
jgi:DNA-binding NarL/FixJ family response regulator